MSQICSGVIPACITGTSLIDGRLIGLIFLIFNVEPEFVVYASSCFRRDIEMTSSCPSGGSYTIEHVNASFNSLKDVFHCTDAQEMTWLAIWQQGNGPA